MAIYEYWDSATFNYWSSSELEAESLHCLRRFVHPFHHHRVKRRDQHRWYRSCVELSRSFYRTVVKSRPSLRRFDRWFLTCVSIVPLLWASTVQRWFWHLQKLTRLWSNTFSRRSIRVERGKRSNRSGLLRLPEWRHPMSYQYYHGFQNLTRCWHQIF